MLSGSSRTDAAKIECGSARRRNKLRACSHSSTSNLRMHGTAPHDLTVSEAVKKYREYLVLNRRERTVTRYRRVLDTFAVCFLQTYHQDIERLRDVKPLHVEDYKRRRSAGEISEQKTLPMKLASSNSGQSWRASWTRRSESDPPAAQKVIHLEA